MVFVAVKDATKNLEELKCVQNMFSDVACNGTRLVGFFTCTTCGKK